MVPDTAPQPVAHVPAGLRPKIDLTGSCKRLRSGDGRFLASRFQVVLLPPFRIIPTVRLATILLPTELFSSWGAWFYVIRLLQSIVHLRYHLVFGRALLRMKAVFANAKRKTFKNPACGWHSGVAMPDRVA